MGYIHHIFFINFIVLRYIKSTQLFVGR